MSQTNSSASSPISPTLDALESDPVLVWLRQTPRPWLAVARDLMAAIACAIVVTLSSEKRHVRAAGRDVFLSCFVPPGATVGTSLCRVTYAAALREVRSARRNQRQRELHLLAGSYEQLGHLGVPKAVCSAARACGESIKARVVERTHDEPITEESLLEVRPERFLLHYKDNTWFFQLPNGEWNGPLSNAGVMSLLNQLGLPDKQARSFLGRARHFDVALPVFGTDAAVVERNGTKVFNTFRAGTVRPRPGAWPDIYRVINSVCNGDTGFREYFLDWLARPVQALYRDGRPELNRTAVALIGREGSGKGTTYAVMQAIYGAQNCTQLSQNDLDGRFAAKLRHKLFVLANEVTSSTNKSDETANKLKEWIADDQMSLEGKNKDGEDSDNYAHIILASQDEAPVKITYTDRRYSVKRSTAKLPAEVVARVKADLAGPQRQVAAFMHHLLTRKVKMQVGEIYDTAERRAIQAATAPAEDQFCRQIAEDGWCSVAADWKDDQPSHMTPVLHHHGFVPSSTLAKVLAHWCKVNGKKMPSANKLTEALRRYIKPGPVAGNPYIGKVRTRGYYGIPLTPRDSSATGGTVTPLPSHRSDAAQQDHASTAEVAP